MRLIEELVPDDIDFERFMSDTDPAEKVRPALDYLDQVMHQLAPAHDSPTSPKLPFNGGWVYFAPGETTVWAGENGTRKSMMTGQVLSEFAEQGQRVCIASFEMKPAKTLARISRQIYRQSMPKREQVEAFLQRNQGRIWLYDHQGSVHPKRIIAVVKHCAEVLRCQHIVIDSLMKIVHDEDDYNGQKGFVDQLTACARDYGIHVHLVHHLRKAENHAGAERLPKKGDVKGSGSITDLVDNLLLIWRNKGKDLEREAGKPVNDSDPDCILMCEKQRNSEWEGRIKLWFEPASLRFADHVIHSHGLASELSKGQP
jgi:twinkle protein